jgi:hypothetical protein
VDRKRGKVKVDEMGYMTHGNQNIYFIQFEKKLDPNYCALNQN